MHRWSIPKATLEIETPMKTFGIILAGGTSTRMGTDKALLTHKGLTLLQHARALLHTLDISETIILGRPNEPDGRKDYAPGEGPAANIAAFINTQKSPFKLVVLPVDMPLIETEQIAHLMSLKQGGFFEDLYLPFYVKITESKNISAVNEMSVETPRYCACPDKGNMARKSGKYQ
ncbi:MAG: NTP transferase domain-containing protein [Kordiimonadaceae bacterium]|nr:NTP transferase domain-containing protein [Kordiimonadaceae bacterium]